MKTLIEAVEKWIDDKITDNIAVDRADRMSHSATVDVQELDAKFDEYERKLSVLHERVGELDRRVQLYLDSTSPESNSEESTVTEEHTERLDDLADRVHTLESEMYAVESATEDIPDTYSIEVMIDDALETKVMDAVMAELDSIDFKVTVER
tara:strand:- start:956 stop:1411 length:456 start_codon:yes stop_codon:yes gene_type:complete